MEPIGVEAGRLRERCADPVGAAADPDLTGLRRRYLRLLESEPVPSDALRRDIRRDLARSVDDGTRTTVIALLLTAFVVLAFTRWVAAVAPTLAGSLGFALDAGLMLTVPAIIANEAGRWRSSLRMSARRELNALLPSR